MRIISAIRKRLNKAPTQGGDCKLNINEGNINPFSKQKIRITTK